MGWAVFKNIDENRATGYFIPEHPAIVSWRDDSFSYRLDNIAVNAINSVRRLIVYV